MCEPVTLAFIAASGAILATAQQRQQADAANDYEEAVYGQRKEAAIETFASLRQREMQEREKAAQDIRAVTSQARQAASAAKLQALETGTGGPSVDLLLSQFERQEVGNVNLVQRNLALSAQQIRDQERAAGRIQGPQVTPGPTFLGTALNVGTAALGGYTQGLSLQQPVV